MKPFILFAASAFPLVAGGALAADLTIVLPPPPIWTGLYGGLNAGGALATSGSIDYATAPSVTGRFLTDPAQAALRAPFWATQFGAIAGNENAGIIGGFQVGYNYQTGSFGGIVAGIEADIQGLAIGGGSNARATLHSGILAAGDSLLNTAVGGSTLQHLGTVRGRLGYLVDPTLLVYATGGLAFGGTSFNITTSSLYTNAAGVVVQNAIGNLDFLSTQPGWAAGAGVEWMFAPRWSVKAEYLYYDLGNGKIRGSAAAYPIAAANAFGGTNGVPSDWTTASVASPRVNGSIVRVGLNYHFAAGAPSDGGHGTGESSDGAHGGHDKGVGHGSGSSADEHSGMDGAGGKHGAGKRGGGHAHGSASSGHSGGSGSGGMHAGHQKSASNLSASGESKHAGKSGAGEGHGRKHTVVPAGVYGAHMVGAGEMRFAYTPSYAVMRGNYIDSSQIAPAQVTTIPWIPNSVYALPNFFSGNPTRTLRNAPDNMKMQMHMFHAMFGVTDWFNVMIMGSLSDRNMCMTVFKGPSGSTPLGPTNSATQGWGDTSVQGLLRLYQDDVHHLHMNFGLSMPTGSAAEEIIHMHPSGQFFWKRAYYGLQLGTGTYDSLFGFTYTGKLDAWSWGFIYRGRVALGDNNEGYLRGPWNEMSAWGGYEILPGLAVTGRAAATIWDRIHGHDLLIWGAQQGTEPGYQGGERVKLLGGLEYLVKLEGFKPIRLAVEAGAPVYQRLNGPQLGESWELNTAVNFGF
jgi:opacity protein-like surface antigen